MATSVYLASSEGLSGKSAIALGLLDQLSRRVGRVGVFRPIVRAKDAAGDHVLDLLLSRLEADLSAQVASGVGYDDVHADGDAAMSTIVERFHAVAERFEAMLVLGSDYTDVTSPTEFSYNARVAANLDAPMLLVITGAGRTRSRSGRPPTPLRRRRAPTTPGCSPSSPTGWRPRPSLPRRRP